VSTPANNSYQQIVQRYYRGEYYLEVDVHVGSSVLAAQIVGLCRYKLYNVLRVCKSYSYLRH
jgi:hypothetical protein